MGAGEHDGKAVVAKMKSMPTDDPLFGKGKSAPTAASFTRPICSK